jgi:transglutaminase-like putative cysteine protease
VWPDFYDEDYGWIPLDPTYKNANPGGDFFGRYDGELIIVSQGLTSFTESNFEMTNIPLQTFAYWYWYTNGIGDITGEHKTSKDYQINAITSVEYDQTNPVAIYNIMGIEQKELKPGINIVNGKKIYVK